MSLMSAAALQAKNDDPNQENADNKWTEQLVSLVPTEAIGVFTGALAFCAGNNWGWGVKWACFAAVAVLIVPWVWLSYWNKLTTEQQDADKFPIPYWSIMMGLAAFTVWSMTIPETPFLQWHVWDLKFAPFVTLFGVAALTVADQVRSVLKKRAVDRAAVAAAAHKSAGTT